MNDVKRSFLALVSLAASVLCCLTAAADEAAAPLQRIALLGKTYDVVFRSLSLSEDGNHLAFGRRPYREGNITFAQELMIMDMRSGQSERVGDILFGREFPQPVWSPNGRFLAYSGRAQTYRGPAEDRFWLRIWDRERKREIFRSEDPAVSVDTNINFPVYPTVTPQWTSNGRFVLYLADVGGDEVSWAEKITPVLRLDKQMVGRTRSPAGVTVLTTPALDKALESRPRWSRGYEFARDEGMERWKMLMALDMRDGKSQVIAAGRGLTGFYPLGNSNEVLVVAKDESRSTEEQGYYDLYRLPLTPTADVSRPAQDVLRAASKLVGRDRRTLKAMIEGLPLSDGLAYKSNISLSPSRRYAAYTTLGQEATGDVFILDIKSGAIRNLTSSLVLGRNPLDTEGAARRGKFATEYLPPVWTRNESAVIVIRAVELSGNSRLVGFELWQVAITSGEAHRIKIDTDLSIEALAQCPAAVSPCLIGRSGELIAKARLLKTDSLAFVAIDPHTGKVRILQAVAPGSTGLAVAEFEKAGEVAFENSVVVQDFVAASSGVIVHAQRSPSEPPELWRIDTGANPSSAKALDVINPGSAHESTVRVRVPWEDTFMGRKIDAWLLLPDGAKRDGSLPVIADVYPVKMSRGVADPAQFNGGPAGYFDQFRTGGGYALLEIDDLWPQNAFSLKTASEEFRTRIWDHVCDHMAASAVAALDAAAKTGLIDDKKAGIFGHSYGGYFVNCVVTRTNRFRAAISSSGHSDWVSTFGSSAAYPGTPAAGATPWDNPQRYIAESPIYHLDRVNTPLLLYYGKLEPLMFGQQQSEMFFGLKSINRPAALVGYDDGDHGSPFDMPDFWERMISWFDAYLKQ